MEIWKLTFLWIKNQTIYNFFLNISLTTKTEKYQTRERSFDVGIAFNLICRKNIHIALLADAYHISSNKRPRRLFNFKDSECGAYQWVALKEGDASKRNESYQIISRGSLVIQFWVTTFSRCTYFSQKVTPGTG